MASTTARSTSSPLAVRVRHEVEVRLPRRSPSMQCPKAERASSNRRGRSRHGAVARAGVVPPPTCASSSPRATAAAKLLDGRRVAPPRRPPVRVDEKLKAPEPQQAPEPAIQYGHVFAVTGDLAVQPIAPRDAAAMRSAEESVPGVPVPPGSGGGFSAAVAMETAAAYNEAVGAVRPGQASDAAAKQGIAVTQTAVPGGRIVTEFVAGQVVGQYSVVADQAMMGREEQQFEEEEEDASKVTIGEAMEAAALSAGDRPLQEADAAAIRAAERQAQGTDEVMPGGLGDQAWAAASANAWAERDEDKITISDVLSV